MHESQTVLKAKLSAASKKVAIGGLYYHYKHPQESYKVLNVAITEWDDEPCVIYEAQYGSKIVFVRPLNSWLAETMWQGNVVSRFTPIA